MSTRAANAGHAKALANSVCLSPLTVCALFLLHAFLSFMLKVRPKCAGAP